MSLVKIRRVSSASLLPLSVSFPFSAVRLPDAIVVVIKQEFDLSFVAQTLVMDGLSIRRGQLCLTTLRITLLNMPLLSAFALPELGLDQLRIVLVISVEAKRTRRVALDVNHTFLAAAAGSGASFSRSNFYTFTLKLLRVQDSLVSYCLSFLRLYRHGTSLVLVTHHGHLDPRYIRRYRVQLAIRMVTQRRADQ